MTDIIKVTMTYELAYKCDRLVDEMWLNPYAINEGLVNSFDTLEIYITPDKLWLLKWLEDYLIV